EAAEAEAAEDAQAAPQREARGQEVRLRLLSPGRQVETRGAASLRRFTWAPSPADVAELRRLSDHPTVDDYQVVAQELSELGEKWRALEERLAEVERVNARLEEAALTTARALGEVS